MYQLYLGYVLLNMHYNLVGAHVNSSPINFFVLTALA